jgi:hypothetical protein
MQRRMVDTVRSSHAPQWEDLAAHALAARPPYNPVPGAPIYHVSFDDGTVVLSAEHDLCGPLLDLVTAVLAMGEVVLAPSPGSGQGPYAGAAVCSGGRCEQDRPRIQACGGASARRRPRSPPRGPHT